MLWKILKDLKCGLQDLKERKMILQNWTKFSIMLSEFIKRRTNS